MMEKLALPEDVELILDKLEFHGFKAYVVGGAIRSLLLRVEPHDFDIATNAKPGQILKAFAGFKIIETGIKHGTVTVVINDVNYEITTFRVDGDYSDNRHPDTVEFVESIIDDLSRRDFTINAMAYNHKEGLIDPFNGKRDLHEKIVCCVGDADERFREDALRMLRAIRFSSQLKFSIWCETKDAIANNAELINNISKERISSELIKILSSSFPAFYLHQLRELFLMKYILPDLDACFPVKQNNPWHIYNVGTHILTTLIEPPEDINVRLALMLHDIGKPLVKTTDENGIDHFYEHEIKSAELAERWLREYKFDNDTIDEVVTLIRWHDYFIEPSKKGVKKLMGIIGKELSLKLLDIRIQDVLAQSENHYLEKRNKIDEIRKMIEEIVINNEAFSVKDLVVNGDDLMSLGYKQGRVLGEMLHELLDHVIDVPEDNKREILLGIAKEKMLKNLTISFANAVFLDNGEKL